MPAIKITLPYSPIHLPSAKPKPVSAGGIISGKITLRNIVPLFAPSAPAASSYDGSSFSSTGCTALTTNGMPINISATTIPILVCAIFIPNGANNFPISPSSVVRFARAKPATAVGSANGSSIIPSRTRLSGKSYLTSTQASMTPIIEFIIDAISEVRKVTLKLARTRGRVIVSIISLRCILDV